MLGSAPATVVASLTLKTHQWPRPEGNFVSVGASFYLKFESTKMDNIMLQGDDQMIDYLSKDINPPFLDIDRMTEALNQKETYTLPEGLTKEEIRTFICNIIN